MLAHAGGLLLLFFGLFTFCNYSQISRSFFWRHLGIAVILTTTSPAVMFHSDLPPIAYAAFFGA